MKTYIETKGLLDYIEHLRNTKYADSKYVFDDIEGYVNLKAEEINLGLNAEEEAQALDAIEHEEKLSDEKPH